MIRPTFASVAEYGRCFTSAEFWRPYVVAICDCHSLGEPRMVRAGLPGTNPVFVVDECYAVKLYTDMFGGAVSYPMERAVYGLIAQAADIPAPALIAAGNLFDPADGWPWPYIITQAFTGLSLGESAVSAADRYSVARWLGPVVRRIHQLPLATDELRADWQPFIEFLAHQRAGLTERQREWGSLPPRLINQIEAFVPPVDKLVDIHATPVLLHCDINRDHILGETIAGVWRPTGIIDFGDARVGDWRYELGAMVLGLFGGDAALVRAFLDAYGVAAHDGFARRALAYTLLHECNVLDGLKELAPAAAEAATLDELARMLFGG